MIHRLVNHYGGWVPQRPDWRDHEFIPMVARQNAPPSSELDVSGIPVLDQGQQGSCVGNGTAGIVMFDQKKQGGPVVVPSRSMLYYDARIPDGTTDQDAGATVRNGVAGVAKYGVCAESEFPYDDQIFNVAPSVKDYADGKLQEALAYEAVRYPHLNQALASGFPIVFGFSVYSSFESDAVAATGVVPMPAPREAAIGGHCTWIFGFNMSTQPWTSPSGLVYPPRTKACRNSWGAGWGDGGNFFLPQSYFDAGLASDYWVIRQIGKG